MDEFLDSLTEKAFFLVKKFNKEWEIYNRDVSGWVSSDDDKKRKAVCAPRKEKTWRDIA